MNDLCADIGYKSINHVGEELCGDHVDVVEENENSTVIVLADGLGYWKFRAIYLDKAVVNAKCI